MPSTKQLLGAAAAAASFSTAARGESVARLLEDIQSQDPARRSAAWQSTHESGAAVVVPLTGLLTHDEVEVVRAARRGLEHLVRHAGRPGAESERAAVEERLIGVLGAHPPVAVQRDVLWLLSEAGSELAVPRIAVLLADPELRDDARMALERIPGDDAVQALQAALQTAPEAFQPALAQSLHARGVPLPNVPNVKLVPEAQTSVQPVQAAS